MTKKTTAAKTEDQSVVYKVPAAFALMILVIYGFWRLAAYYATLAGFEALYGPVGTAFYVSLALLAAIALVTYLCAKNRGKLPLGGKLIRLFPSSFNPLLFYFICGLWAVMLAACMIFGQGFAFYAMFAAIALELIGAAYYTFQLK